MSRDCALTFCVCALSVALLSAPASGQFIEVVPSETTVELGTDGTATIDVSIWADRDGATGGFWDQFYGWQFVEGWLALRGDAQWIAPVENLYDTTADDWYGRRPAANLDDGPAANGAFRAPNLVQEYGVASAADLAASTGFTSWAAAYDSVLGRGDGLGTLIPYANSGPYGINPSQDERVELFRAQLVLTGIGETDLFFNYNDNFGTLQQILIDEAIGRYEPVESRGATVTVVPAPGVLAVLAPAVFFRRRRA